MIEIKNPFAGVKVEYTRSHPLTKVAVIMAILLSMAALITLSITNAQLRAQIVEMRTEAARLEAENAALEDRLEKLDDIDTVEDIAQEELDLVDPDTIVIEPNP